MLCYRYNVMAVTKVFLEEPQTFVLKAVKTHPVANFV